MTKKRSTPAKPKRRSDEDQRSLLEDILSLVQQGSIAVAGSGDYLTMDTVLVPIPDDMQVPLAVDADTRLAEDRLLLEQSMIPERLAKELRNNSTARWAHFKRMVLKPLIEAATGRTFEQVWKSLAHHDPDGVGQRLAAEIMLAGFDAALSRYAAQLKSVLELARFYTQRREGGDRGRRTQAQRKADRQRDAHRLLAEGHEVEAIGTALGCSLRTVYRLLRTPPPADA